MQGQRERVGVWVTIMMSALSFECDRESLNWQRCFGGVAGLFTNFPDKGVPIQSGPLGFRDR